MIIIKLGIGLVIVLDVDFVANEVARSSLKPKIEDALIQWRLKTINTFRTKMLDKLASMHAVRRQLIAEMLDKLDDTYAARQQLIANAQNNYVHNHILATTAWITSALQVTMP